MTKEAFAGLISDCRKEWKDAWSKEFREMDEDRLSETILGYMKNWLMVRCDGELLAVLPTAGRGAGFYPDDFKGGTAE